MIARLIKHINEHIPLHEDMRFLLAISGGKDSVAMLDLFYRAGLSFDIAHFNYKIRGIESEEDEQFVRELSQKYNVRFHLKKQSPEELSEPTKDSIQSKARIMRYEWMNDLVKSNKYTCFCTAHHKDDQTETFFINAIRGTGWRGLSGIKPYTQNLLRPILFTDKNEIEQYVKGNNISYREDSSNQSLKYLRNHVRHKVIPECKINHRTPKNTIPPLMQSLQKIESIINDRINNFKNEIFNYENDNIFINKQKLTSIRHYDFLFPELLKEYGFNESTCRDVINSLGSNPGKWFYSSKSYRLLNDRDFLIITTKKTNEENTIYNIEEGTNKLTLPFGELSLKLINKKEFNYKPQNEYTAYFDYSQLSFPFKIRKWDYGDKIKPLGMNGFKKISDLLTDKKLSMLDKEKIHVLVSGNKIAWVIGIKISDEFKVKPDTKKVFIAEFNFF